MSTIRLVHRVSSWFVTLLTIYSTAFEEIKRRLRFFMEDARKMLERGQGGLVVT
jgi:hypothetical protein